MTSTWDYLTLSSFSLSRWRGSSYVYQLVGSLRSWRQGSWFMQWGEPLGAMLIAILLAFAPFAATDQIGVLLIAIIGYWLVLTLADDTPPSITPIHLLLFFYWGFALVAVAFSPVKMAALVGWGKLTLYLGMFVLAARVLRSPRLTNWLITTILLVSLLVSGYGIRQQLFGVEQLATWNDPASDLAGATRVYSYLGNPNLLAAYLFVPIALSMAAIFVWQKWLPKVLAGTILIVNLACLYFTGSRGGWIGVVALSLTFLLLLYAWYRDWLPPFWRTWLLPLTLGILAALLVLGLIFVDPLRIRVLSIFAGRQDSSNNFRLNVWTSVIDMIRDRPFIGIGPGDRAFKQVYPLYMQPKYSALSAYSIYLETAVETGLIGLSLMLWFLVITINQGVRQINRLRQHNNLHGFWLMAAIAGMVAFLAHGFVDTVWYRPQINTLWWFLVAIIASQYRPLKSVQDAIDQEENQKAITK